MSFIGHRLAYICFDLYDVAVRAQQSHGVASAHAHLAHAAEVLELRLAHAVVDNTYDFHPAAHSAHLVITAP